MTGALYNAMLESTCLPRHRTAAFLLLALLALLAAAATATAAVGVAAAAGADTSGLARYEGFHMAPDGSKLLMLRADGEHYDVVVRSFHGDDERTILRGADDTGLINWCRWANDTRMVCSLRYYRNSGRAGRIIHTRLLAVDHDGSAELALIPRAKNYDRRPTVWNPQVQDRVISWLPSEPEVVLIQLNRDSPNRPSVYRLNIYSNSLSRVIKPRKAVRRWYANSAGEVLLATGYRGGEEPILYRFADRRVMPLILPEDQSEIPATPLVFAPDGDHVFMNMTAGSDRHGIYRMNVNTGDVTAEVFVDPDFDVFGLLLMDPDSGQPAGLRYERHKPLMVWFDDEYRTLFANLAKQLPGERVEPVSGDTQLRRFVVRNYGGIVPTFHLYDQPTRRLTRLGSQFPYLDDKDVVALEPMSYPARDGTSVPAYLAVPPGASGPQPTVIMPHGGPYARDSAAFDYWTQFLVGQGYVVLKPNYRGSVGYGEAFMRAGYQQWGLQMQEDVMDGLDWLVARGYTDPDKVCLVGASFGGYTALVSAFKFPDRIQCAVSFAGITDLERLVRRINQFDLNRRNRIRIQDGAALLANSPFHQAKHIDVPLLIVHGDADSVVRVRQSQDFVKSLARYGKEYRYVEQPDGDHFLSSRRQSAQFFGEMKTFLESHISDGGD